MLRRYTGAPLRAETTTLPTSAAVASGAPTSIRYTESAVASSPACSRALAPFRAIATSPGVTPLAASRAGSSMTLICFGRPPTTNVSATSGTVRISSSRCVAIWRSAFAS